MQNAKLILYLIKSIRVIREIRLRRSSLSKGSINKNLHPKSLLIRVIHSNPA
jgi:hypothetical protein